jgi:NTE family protein
MHRELSQLEKKPGTALVLSGGATKAFYFHIGVLKAVELEDVHSIVGTSAGALVGALIATGTTVDTLTAVLLQQETYIPRFDAIVKSINSGLLFQVKPGNVLSQGAETSIEIMRFLLTLPLQLRRDVVADVLDRLILSQRSVSGFFTAENIEKLFKTLLPSNDFTQTEMDLYVTATGLDTHERAIFNGRYDFENEDNHFITDVPIHKAVRASMSVPGMFEPVKIKNRYYIDGEVKQTLSLDIGLALADKVIVSHTYQPLYRPNGQSVAEMGWLTVFKQAVHAVFYERIAIWRDLYQREFPEKQIIWIQPEPDDAELFLAPEFSFRPEVQKLMIRSGEMAAHKALEYAGKKGG